MSHNDFIDALAYMMPARHSGKSIATTQLAAYRRLYPDIKKWFDSFTGNIVDIETDPMSRIRGQRPTMMIFDDLKSEAPKVKQTKQMMIDTMKQELENTVIAYRETHKQLSAMNGENNNLKNDIANKNSIIASLKSEMHSMEMQLVRVTGILEGRAQVLQEQENKEPVTISRGELNRLTRRNNQDSLAMHSSTDWAGATLGEKPFYEGPAKPYYLR